MPKYCHGNFSGFMSLFFNWLFYIVCFSLFYIKCWVAIDQNCLTSFHFIQKYSIGKGWEYVDCITQQRDKKKTSKKGGYSWYDSELHLMVRLQFWWSKEYRVLLHSHYYLVHSVKFFLSQNVMKWNSNYYSFL